jgi:hypothetical protein
MIQAVICLAFNQLQAHPMFARFHYSYRPKAIVPILVADLGGDGIAFLAKLEYLVLTETVTMRFKKMTSKSNTHRNQRR